MSSTTQQDASPAVDPILTAAPARKPFTPPKSGVFGVTTAIIRTVAMWSYFLSTIAILWLLMPVLLLHPLLRGKVHSRYLPYDLLLRYWARMGALVAGISPQVDIHPDVLQLENCVLVANHSSTLGMLLREARCYTATVRWLISTLDR
jgi:uncharacterized membrane protein YdfJ with MMPL/SSD domain